jgi:hypothetical protein
VERNNNFPELARTLKHLKLGTLGHIGNNSYLGGRNWENLSLKLAQARGLQGYLSTNKKVGMVAQV